MHQLGAVVRLNRDSFLRRPGVHVSFGLVLQDRRDYSWLGSLRRADMRHVCERPHHRGQLEQRSDVPQRKSPVRQLVQVVLRQCGVQEQQRGRKLRLRGRHHSH